ncbi:MAG: hypothetical protein PHF57_03485 [Methanoregula sp.]|nr:hypothetical protein [Methanoregula sp.]
MSIETFVVDPSFTRALQVNLRIVTFPGEVATAFALDIMTVPAVKGGLTGLVINVENPLASP